MKLIQIQNSDKSVKVDDADFEKLVSLGPWYLDGKGTVCNKGWTKMHHILMGVIEIDHKDRDQLNNQRENLRPCTRSQNMANTSRRSTNTSGFKGVRFHEPTGKWQAYIKVDYKQKSLGLYTKIEEAAFAYDKAAKQFFGEFAKLNFP